MLKSSGRQREGFRNEHFSSRSRTAASSSGVTATGSDNAREVAGTAQKPDQIVLAVLGSTILPRPRNLCRAVECFPAESIDPLA